MKTRIRVTMRWPNPIWNGRICCGKEYEAEINKLGMAMITCEGGWVSLYQSEFRVIPPLEQLAGAAE